MKKKFAEYYAESPVDLRPVGGLVKVKVIDKTGGPKIYDMQPNQTVKDLIDTMNSKEKVGIRKVVGTKLAVALRSIADANTVEFKTQMGEGGMELLYSPTPH